MKNGRCHLHGGLSTGPKTKEGKEKSRLSGFKHGLYTQESKEQNKQVNALIRMSKDLLRSVDLK